ncbi:MAG: sugar phosphate isomerase/epimerase [Candidatus Pacearchaeota archaeon]|nr:sugar phosphate isomerase/epimerase [Candidatus Pacearchaeota archaeon]
MAYRGVESFYSGTYSSLEPNPEYGPLFTGYRVDFKRLGAPTSPQTANQLKEASDRLSEGTMNVEFGALQPDVFETIPKQQFAEASQLMKLTGARASLHAPLIDPAGFTKEGWTEHARQESERQILQVLERAKDLDEKGNVPVTLHATSGIPAFDWAPQRGKTPEGKESKDAIYIVNRETGELNVIKREIRGLPSPIYKKDPTTGEVVYRNNKPVVDDRVKEIKRNGKLLYDVPPEVRLEEMNQRQWRDPLSSIEYNKSIVERNMEGYAKLAQRFHNQEKLGDQLSQEEKETSNEAKMELKTVRNLMEDYDFQLKNLYHYAYTYSNGENKEKLMEATKRYNDQIAQVEKLSRDEHGNPMDYDTLINDDPKQFAKIVKLKSEAERDLINGMRRVQPKIFVESEQFALEKTKETLGNAALMAFKQFGDKAPMLCVENFFPNTVFSRAESLKKLVEDSRKQFVEKAKEQGIDEGIARSAASRLIGATWDTGHINLLRKYGYGEKEGIFKPEEYGKFLAEETKKIAPFVKHVHLTDNFGYNDSHLVPGMGEVPFKEVMKELEKAGYSGREIVEAGGMIAQKLGMPTPYILEAFGSGFYGSGPGGPTPNWNQVRASYGTGVGYFGGYGAMLPEQHFSMYGSGFASLPQELGGQMPGKGQRFSGAPME